MMPVKSRVVVIGSDVGVIEGLGVGGSSVGEVMGEGEITAAAVRVGVISGAAGKVDGRGLAGIVCAASCATAD